MNECARTTRSRIIRGAGRSCAVLLAIFSTSPAQSQDVQPTAYTHAIRYDGVGRVVGRISPDPDGSGPLKFAGVRTRYNALGLPVRIETGELASWQPSSVVPNSWTGFTVKQTQHFAYDTMNRQIKTWIVGSDGQTASVTQTNYDKVGRPACIAIRMNPAAFASLPANPCVLGPTGSQGPDRITQNKYDAAGQLVKVQKAYGVTTANGFPTTLQQDYATYEYSSNGKQTSVTDARGFKASMVYDGHDRQIEWHFPSPTAVGTPSATDYEEYTYDKNGNRLTLQKRDGSEITYQYDGLNRVTRKTIPTRTGLAGAHTRDVFYAYDLRGLQTDARFDSLAGDGVETGYDGFGRAISSKMTMSGRTRALAYAYDRNGNRTGITHPDNIAFTYEYDRLDRVTRIRENGSAVLATIAYDDQGRRASVTRRGGDTTTYAYDPASRLGSIGHSFVGGSGDISTAYSHNPASQITRKTRSNDAYAWNGHVNLTRAYVVNGLNQYKSAGPATFGYDKNGNLTSDGSNTYVYDIENRLVGASGDASATLLYDPLGRLHQTSGGSAGTTQFLYDGDKLIAEYAGSAATPARRYVHGTGLDEPLVWYEGAGLAQPKYFHADHQGSITGIADAAGRIDAINSYDAYGIPDPNHLGRFAYTGQIRIPELDMYYYKARVYSPTLGRFLQTDPIGYEDQINLYAYVGNDPVNNSDPTGKCFEMSCPGSYTEPYLDQQIRQGDRVASAMIAQGLYEGSGLAAIAQAINEPTAGNIAMAAVGVTPAGRVLGPLYKAGRGAQQVARKLGLSPVARASRDGRGIRFGGRSGNPAQVRVMRGNPDSPNPAQQKSYVTVRDANGNSYNADGKIIRPTEDFPIPGKNPQAHISVERFDPDRFGF